LLEDRDSIHLFGSPFERGPIRARLKAAVEAKARVYLVSEPYMTAPVGYNDDLHPVRDAIKAFARPLAYRARTAQLRDRISGVFAISPLAVKQFTRLGFGQVFPFGYFLPPFELAPVPPRKPELPLKMAYVGSMIRRKNVAALISAMGRIDVAAARLDLYGSTPLQQQVGNLSNVHAMGRIEFGRTRQVLRDYDVLAVPSLHDGWGVVVNEAIEAGCAVVCSDETGASVLVRNWQCGLTFPARRADLLAERIQRLVSSPGLLAQFRANAVRHAPELASAVAGRYMAQAIECGAGGVPQAPWYA
jgi:glycosyltransferase involved in cell wall biosynthesis